MTRPIKFRAWDKEKNQMIEADWLTEIEWNKSDNPDAVEYNDGEGLMYTNDFELMQYTGLKDKNGVEIYEGDIMHLKLDEVNGQVVFAGGGFWVKWPHLEKHTFTTALWELNSDNEVIGNIYENAELKEAR